MLAPGAIVATTVWVLVLINCKLVTAMAWRFRSEEPRKVVAVVWADDAPSDKATPRKVAISFICGQGIVSHGRGVLLSFIVRTFFFSIDRSPAVSWSILCALVVASSCCPGRILHHYGAEFTTDTNYEKGMPLVDCDLFSFRFLPASILVRPILDQKRLYLFSRIWHNLKSNASPRRRRNRRPSSPRMPSCRTSYQPKFTIQPGRLVLRVARARAIFWTETVLSRVFRSICNIYQCRCCLGRRFHTPRTVQRWHRIGTFVDSFLSVPGVGAPDNNGNVGAPFV
jgi:hypothetical protein